MDKLFLTIDELNALLNKWVGQYIRITKHEINDRDETVIDLKSISYNKNHDTIDDYQSKYTMHLNGEGHMMTEQNTVRPLPENQYDIPLDDGALYEFDESEFIISTKRGIYQIEIDYSYTYLILFHFHYMYD